MKPHQELLSAILRDYRGADPVEEGHRRTILRHVEREERWWHRETLPGHVTASAFVADATLDQLLLHHHRKLDRWLQLGGHDDGERDPARAALREVAEESGLERFDFFGDVTIFDLDVHPIPARGAMAAHDHYDVRFLMVADPAEPLRRDEAESKALRWFPLEQAEARMDEPGAQRVVEKIRLIRAQRGGSSSK